MAMSVLFLARTLSLCATIKAVLEKEAVRFYLAGQFYHPLDALSFSTALKPQIVILEELCFSAFISWQQFVRELCAKVPQTQYILISESCLSVENDFVVDLPASEVSHASMLDALNAVAEKAAQSSQTSAARHYHLAGGSWFRSSQQFSELISNAAFVQSARFDRSLIKVQNNSGWLLVGEPRNIRSQTFSFFQDPGQLDSLLQELTGILHRASGGNAFITSDHQICIWVTASSTNLQGCLDSLEKLCKQVNRSLSAAGFFSCGFQCSSTPVTLEQLGQAYRVVSALCPYRFFVNDDLLLYSQWLTRNSVPMDFPEIDALIVQLQSAIARCDHELLHDTFAQLLSATIQTYSVTSYHYVWCELVFLHNQQLQQHNALSEELLPNFCYNDFSKIQDAFQVLETFFEKLLLFLANHQSKYSTPYIRQVVEYVNDHFTEELLLSDVAEHVHISVSYLSRLFKKEVGCPFTDFVNELRIQRAKELLLDSGCKIYEIAARVGFENTKYFSQVFKAQTGQSPKEYQAAAARKDEQA